MPTSPITYRLYRYDADLQIVSADWLDAANDEDAVGKAYAQGFGAKGELWDGKRLVAHLEAERRQA